MKKFIAAGVYSVAFILSSLFLQLPEPGDPFPTLPTIIPSGPSQYDYRIEWDCWVDDYSHVVICLDDDV